MSKKFLVLFVLVIAASVVATYYFSFKAGYSAAKKDQDSLVNKVTGGTVNPVENMPSANPFETIKTNPFEGINVNPFK